MRLIDADTLVESLIKCKGLGRNSCGLVADVIKNQPTAYDGDKVVEQIKRLSPANYVSKDDVLKIVKGGRTDV